MPADEVMRHRGPHPIPHAKVGPRRSVIASRSTTASPGYLREILVPEGAILPQEADLAEF